MPLHLKVLEKILIEQQKTNELLEKIIQNSNIQSKETRKQLRGGKKQNDNE